MAEPPVIVSLISDLFLAAPVEQAVRATGHRLIRLERRSDVKTEGETESGQAAAFVRSLADWQPALILAELSSRAIPWADWISAAKASPATRRIPVIGFGPHTDLALRARALDVGCDLVIANSRLLSALPELIDRYARHPDTVGLEAGCQGQLSELALKGLQLFNDGAYFEAHEELELAWGADTRPVRELYRALLQVAVAYLHITRLNYAGAAKMFLRLRQWLDPLPDECQGLDITRLRAEVQAARAELERLGPDRLSEFDRGLLKPVMVKPRAN